MVTEDGSDIPSELERVVFRCLAKSRYHRPASAIQLEQQLAELPLAEWQPTSTPPDQVPVDSRADETSESGLANTTSIEVGRGGKPTT